MVDDHARRAVEASHFHVQARSRLDKSEDGLPFSSVALWSIYRACRPSLFLPRSPPSPSSAGILFSLDPSVFLCSQLSSPPPSMTRGNQRETDRLRAQARAVKNAAGPKVTAGEATKKKESDAEAMRKKQEKADLKKKEEEAAAAKSKAGGQIVKAKIEM